MQNFFYIIKQETIGESASFQLSLNPQCEVYDGHFPGHAIAPGACNIEMIRQCASIAMQKDVRLSKIVKCKFLALIEPTQQHPLTLELKWNNHSLMATLFTEKNPMIQLKANIQV